MDESEEKRHDRFTFSPYHKRPYYLVIEKSKKLLITKTRNRLIGIQRYVLWNWVNSKESYYISEFPKSGGTWFCQMLSELTGVPFPRNKFVATWPCIFHSHLLPHKNHNNPIIIIRDGRDVMVSAYHHFIIPNNHCPSHEQNRWKQLLNCADIYDVKNNMSRFISVFHKNYLVGGRNITWQNHLLNSREHSHCFIKYEDLLKKPKSELNQVLQYLNLNCSDDKIDITIEKYSFEKLKTNNPSSDFLRKGIAGDWKNVFNYQAGKLFHELGGEALSSHNYISDSTWYEQLDQ